MGRFKKWILRVDGETTFASTNELRYGGKYRETGWRSGFPQACLSVPDVCFAVWDCSLGSRVKIRQVFSSLVS